MDEEMLRQVIEAVRAVCEKPGFGEVSIVIEKKRPRRLRVIVDSWLEPRGIDVVRQGANMQT